jgi:transcriptional regulator with XRE-family HTH domain
MSGTIGSDPHIRLVEFLTTQRKKAGLTQADVAGRLGRHQSLVANIETGQRRVDVVELIQLARAIGFDPKVAVRYLERGT